MNKVTLYQATEQLISNLALRSFVKSMLIRSGDSTSWLYEEEPNEVHIMGLTISFSWDYITIVNETTNEVVHTTSSCQEVKDFIYNYYLNR